MIKYIIILLLFIFSCKEKNKIKTYDDKIKSKTIKQINLTSNQDTINGYLTFSNDSVFFIKNKTCNHKYLFVILNYENKSFSIKADRCEKNLKAFGTKIYSNIEEISKNGNIYRFTHVTNSIIKDDNYFKNKKREFIINSKGEILFFNSNYKRNSENLPFFYSE